MSPQLFICAGCGCVMWKTGDPIKRSYKDTANSRDIVSPDEVTATLDGRCPNCGKKLVFKPDDPHIKVRPL